MDYQIKDLNVNQLQPSSLHSSLELYKTVPIAFEVKHVYLIDSKRSLSQNLAKVEPYIKNYDDFEDPIVWNENWDLKNWGIIFVYHSNDLVGGAIIAWNTSGVNMLENRDDLAVLWDIRIHPDHRNKGVGSKLFNYVIDWSINRNCNELKIETQNNNVGAVNFYLKMGCELKEINENAYSTLPDEIQLIFTKNL
ncbi:MAG: GNAT family N-acetyltransferase [Candidatus Kariarchaeaceae archaeon]